MNEELDLQRLGYAGLLASEWLDELHRESPSLTYFDYAELFAVEGGFLSALDDQTLSLLLSAIALRLRLNLGE